MTIKILEKIKGCMPEIIDNGEWIDLKLAEDVTLPSPYANTLHKYKKDNAVDRTRDLKFYAVLASLGICVQMPKGFEALIVPRSSSFKKYGILQVNSVGIIDNSYCSDKDMWGFYMLGTREVTIPKGTRIAQFRIQLSQKATVWQKIKWLLSPSIKLQKVSSLSNKQRGGFGSTGEK